MKSASLSQADAYYQLATAARLSWRSMDCPSLGFFAEAVFRLSQLARRYGSDDAGWREFLYPARRARNIATTVPLRFSDPDLGLAPLVTRLEGSLRALAVYGGEEAGRLGGEAVDAARALLALDDAPLADAILQSTLPSYGDPARMTHGILIPIPEFTLPVQEFLDALGRGRTLHVLSAQDIVAVKPLARLIVVGPLHWYRGRQFVLTSPRAPEIVVLKWAWYKEAGPSTQVLEGSRGAAGIKVRAVPIVTAILGIAPEEERSEVDWKAVSEELSRPGETDPLEPVAARAAVLAGRHGVLLPENGDRRVWLLDPQAPAEHRVTPVDVSDLEPGHVIVLRTAGGGDLIVPLADEILGVDAPALRGLQHRWKEGLRSWASGQRGLASAAAELKRRGCAAASPQNLQNWLAERSLRTENRQDWQVLMAAASLEADAQTIWTAMGRLHGAHSEAGLSIGRRLREMANSQPLDTLAATGRQVFRLARGGSLTAFRVEGFSPVVVQCSPNRLMVPTPIMDEWLT